MRGMGAHIAVPKCSACCPALSVTLLSVSVTSLLHGLAFATLPTLPYLLCSIWLTLRGAPCLAEGGGVLVVGWHSILPNPVDGF